MESTVVLGAAAQAVLQVLLLASVGGVLEYAGELGSTRRGALSTLAYRVLLPCLMFVNVGDAASAEALKTMWVLPVYAALYLAAGLAVGACVGACVARRGDQFTYAHISTCVMLGNNGYLPLVLIPSVMNQRALHPPGTDYAGEMKRATASISLFIVVINTFTWAVGPPLLRLFARREAQRAAAVQAPQGVQLARGASSHALTGDESEERDAGLVGVTAANEEDVGYDMRTLNDDDVDGVKQQSSPGSGEAGNAGKTGVSSEVEDPMKKLHRWQQRLLRLMCTSRPAMMTSCARVVITANGIITPPVTASLCGLSIGLIPPLKYLFFSRPRGVATTLSAATYMASALQSSVWNMSMSGSGGGGAIMHTMDGMRWCAAGPAPCTDYTDMRMLLHADVQASSVFPAHSSVSIPFSGGEPPVPPLAPTITSAMTALAAAVTPIVAILLGSSIAERGPGTAAAEGKKRLSLLERALGIITGDGAVRLPALLAVSAGRLVFMPMVGLLLTWLGLRAGIIAPTDLTIIFTLLVEASTPPAMNLQLICEVIGSGGGAMARVICFTYIASVFSLTAWFSVYLALLRSGGYVASALA